MKNKCILIIVLPAFLAGCGSISQGKSFMVRYEEPNPETDPAPLAKLRVLAWDGQVRAVPNSSCIDHAKPGSGMVASSNKPFLISQATLNDQNRDMPTINSITPQKTEYGKIGVAEIYLYADKPISLLYLSNGRGDICRQAVTFVPKKYGNYQISFSQMGQNCFANLENLDGAQKKSSDEDVVLIKTGKCNFTDFFY